LSFKWVLKLAATEEKPFSSKIGLFCKEELNKNRFVVYGLWFMVEGLREHGGKFGPAGGNGPSGLY
jgi:hypothetical protein